MTDETRSSRDAAPDRVPELRTIAMPADTNGAGDIFGGWLLAQMDLAGGVHAMQAASGRVATVGIEAMSFHRPVLVGDLVSCYCSPHRVGRTSLAVNIETWVRRRAPAGGAGDVIDLKVTEGVFTYVALDEDGSKRLLPDSLTSRKRPG